MLEMTRLEGWISLLVSDFEMERGEGDIPFARWSNWRSLLRVGDKHDCRARFQGQKWIHRRS